MFYFFHLFPNFIAWDQVLSGFLAPIVGCAKLFVSIPNGMLITPNIKKSPKSVAIRHSQSDWWVLNFFLLIHNFIGDSNWFCSKLFWINYTPSYWLEFAIWFRCFSKNGSRSGNCRTHHLNILPTLDHCVALWIVLFYRRMVQVRMRPLIPDYWNSK